ncbi:hypothetical protein GCM10027300_29260 [Modestobacter lapidis]
MFSRPPTEGEWLAALAHQGRIEVGAAVALNEVAAHWARAVSSPDD